jgi:hypothetical protein
MKMLSFFPGAMARPVGITMWSDSEIPLQISTGASSRCPGRLALTS